MFCLSRANHEVKKVFEFKTRQAYFIYEAFQGVLATSDIAPKLQKCRDNFVPEHQQPTETYRKKATKSDSGHPFLILTK